MEIAIIACDFIEEEIVLTGFLIMQQSTTKLDLLRLLID
jgi:hypothetical protein